MSEAYLRAWQGVVDLIMPAPLESRQDILLEDIF